MSHRDWFLVQFKPNAHRLAERNLIRQNYRIFLPLQEVTKRKATRFVNDLRPLFPGYLFVETEPSPIHWRAIKGTMGVSKLVSFDGVPRAVPADLISGLQARCDESGRLRTHDGVTIGDEVTLLSGPFANFIATVEQIDRDRRVWVLMDFMGQKSRIPLNADQIQRN